MPTFDLVRGYISNTLSNLLPDMREYLCLRQLFYALVFLRDDGEHLCLYCLHLLVQLLETHHLAPVPMYLGLQQVVTHLDQCCVNIERLMPSGQELTEVVVTTVCVKTVQVFGGFVLIPVYLKM